MKTKNRIWFCSVIVMGLILILTSTCKKDEDSNNKITDVDGNIYTSVTIGTQVWMKENLKTTKYNDGATIPLVTDNGVWKSSLSPAYCWYDNNISNKEPYGALYNWYAVSTTTNGGKNICPSGWHVPTDDEWKQLEMHLGMSQADADNTGTRGTAEGGKLKESGTTHWADPNTGGTNEIGFTALPGGYRHTLGNYYVLGSNSDLWSSTEASECCGWGRDLSRNTSSIERYDYNKTAGFSVRCLKDN